MDSDRFDAWTRRRFGLGIGVGGAAAAAACPTSRCDRLARGMQ